MMDRLPPCVRQVVYSAGPVPSLKQRLRLPPAGVGGAVRATECFPAPRCRVPPTDGMRKLLKTREFGLPFSHYRIGYDR
jgi:hypothetical protein